MIRVGENPEGLKGYNKFIAPCGEGQRGRIVALHKDKQKAIILAQNSSCKGDVVWGKLYLIEEPNEEEYPRVVNQVDSIPNTKRWQTVI